MTPLVLPEGCTDSLHLRKVREYFGGSVSGQIIMPPGVRPVFLCFSNRCGSNYLAQLLGSTGRLNVAKEILNWEEVAKYAAEFRFTGFPQYFANVARWDVRSGLFIAKLATEHLPLLVESGLLAHCRADAAFLMMERDDKLGQAISLEIAAQTQHWTSYMPAGGAGGEPVYSRTAVAAAIDRIVEDNRCFDAFFARNGIVPTRIVYEQLQFAPQGQVDYVMARLGLRAVPIVHERVRVERQTTAINDLWRRKYLDGDAT